MATLPLRWTQHPPSEYTGGAMTIGNFDGVHRGHQALVRAAKLWANRVEGPAVAVTFDPPPVHLLNPSAIKPPLSTLADRTEQLHRAGADHVIVLQTDPGLLALSPEAFFEDVMVRLFHAKAVAEGYNFRFGRGRSGDTRTLRELCANAGVAFEEVTPQFVGGEPVSSSRVRAALLAGDVASVAEMLGRAYGITGTVGIGAKRGRTLGFPTANLEAVETLVPSVGVYAGQATLPDGRTLPAAANIGPNPTFGDESRKIEVHILDFTGDLYGSTLQVEFVTRLRDTRPFANVAELTDQLHRDIAATRVALEAS